MIDRAAVVGAVAAELDAREERCLEEHAEIGERVADRLGLVEGVADRDPKPENVILPRWLFVRRTSWVPPDDASRIGGAIVCTRSSAGRVSLDRAWCASVLKQGGAIAGWEWMLEPGTWREGLEAEVDRLASVGAVALVINVEPASGASKGTAKDWRGRHAELADYTSTARALCDAAGLELWVTSWALPSAAQTFPWRELLQHAHRAIPQPYEVHGREGAAYVAQSIAEYRAHGAREIILGRGAHELDDSDPDAWRTPAQIREHRESTPAGMPEAWWVPAGDLRRRPAVVDAIVEPRLG